MLTKTPAAFLLMLLRISQSILTPAKDAQVTCLFLDDCTLPCSFRPSGAVVIHWYKQQIPVHSYYYNKDQFGLQNKHFSGRTCLFNLKIAHGNASLVLRKVKVQDRGRYKCYTSTRKGNQEMFVNLGVKALIQMVKVDVIEDKIICTAQNIYPAPHLFWSTEPPTDTADLQNRTHVMADTKGLFTIESTIGTLGNVTQRTYFCSVVSADGSQVWTASVKQQDELFSEEGSAMLIPCLVLQPRHNFTLTWTFSGTGESVVIFTYDSRTRRTFNLWDSKAELDVEQVHQGNASLTLLDPESSAHSGTYTCTMSSFQMKHRVQTRVNFTVQVTDVDENACERSWWGTAASVFIFLLIISVALTRCFRHRDQQKIHSHVSDKRQNDQRSNSSETPTLSRPNPQRPNGQAAVTNDPGSQRPDGPQSSAAEAVMFNIYTDNRNTPVISSSSPAPPSDTSRTHCTALTAPSSDDPEESRCEAGLREDGDSSVGTDPELPQTNEFRYE